MLICLFLLLGSSGARSYQSPGTVIPIYPPGGGVRTVLSGACLVRFTGTPGTNPIVGGTARLGTRLGICAGYPDCIGSSYTSPPFCFYFDTTRFANGDYYVLIEVFDRYDANASTTVYITIANPPVLPDTQSPQACIQFPREGYQVPNGKNATVTIASLQSDNVGVVSADLLVNGVQVNASTTAPYDFAWRPQHQGAYQLQIRTWDAAGNSGVSDIVNVVK